MMTTNFTLRLSPEIRQKLNTLAEVERRKPGDVLRIVLIDELARRGLWAENAAGARGGQEQ